MYRILRLKQKFRVISMHKFENDTIYSEEEKRMNTTTKLKFQFFFKRWLSERNWCVRGSLTTRLVIETFDD